MAKVTAGDPIDAFLSEAERHLRRHLSTERLAQVLDEAQGHMCERAAELIASGVAPAQAAGVAATAFGDARSWSCDIVQAAYGDGRTRQAGRIGAASALITLFGALWIGSGWMSTTIPIFSIILPALTIVAGVVFVAESLRSRTFVVGPILAFGVAACLLAFVYCGLKFVFVEDFPAPYPRTEIARCIQSYQTYIVQPQEEYKLLCLGQLIFRVARTHPNTIIPDVLKANGGYIVPVPQREQPRTWVSPFKKGIPAIGHVDWNIALAAEPYRTVATIPEAAAAWDRNASGYMMYDFTTIESCRREIANFRRAQATAPRFDLSAGWYGAQTAVLGTILVVIANWLAASAGRWVFRRRKTVRRQVA